MGMIAAFGFNFAPKNWALCAGQLIPIQTNTALFSLIGTYYGGNGTTNFALPDLRSRVAIGMGQGPGLSSYSIGQVSGTENVTLLTTEIPAHNHQMMASGDGASANVATNNSLASSSRSVPTMPTIYAPGNTTPTPMASTTSQVGGNQPHDNMQPYLAINYCIALIGIFPSRN